MSTLQIRKAQKADMPLIARFIRSSFDWYKPFLHEDDLSDHKADPQWQVRNYEKREFYIGEISNKTGIGTLSLQHFGDITYIGYLFLDIKYVGHGYGKALMNFAKKKCLERGQSSIILLAHPEAKWAVKAYKKFGFKCLHKDKDTILSYKEGILKSYYEEGFYLFEYKLDPT